MQNHIKHSELREKLTQGIQKAINNAFDKIRKTDEPSIVVSRNGKIVHVTLEIIGS